MKAQHKNDMHSTVPSFILLENMEAHFILSKYNHVTVYFALYLWPLGAHGHSLKQMGHFCEMEHMSEKRTSRHYVLHLEVGVTNDLWLRIFKTLQ